MKQSIQLEDIPECLPEEEWNKLKNNVQHTALVKFLWKNENMTMPNFERKLENDTAMKNNINQHTYIWHKHPKSGKA